MNNLKKVVLEVKVGDAFICIKESNFFTKDRVYKIESCNYDIGTGDTTIEFLDNDLDIHPITEKFLATNFKKQ